jgi:5'-nucleotidase / UDP-sugar diphosphatase
VSRFAVCALLGLVGCVGSAPPPIPLKPVRFLLVSDVSVADTIAGGRGGLARVATVRNRLADQGRTLFVLAGDVLSPSVLSKYFSGRQMIEAFNAAKLDYATFGNQDFDIQADTLASMVAASKFKWISSNCTLANGSPIPKVLPWDTLRVSGHKVGLFGLTLQGPYRPEIRCTDPDSAAKRTVETLSAEGADLIVAISHQSVKADRDLLVREPRIDLVLGGHEHQALDSTFSGRHVVKADANTKTAQFVTLWGGKGSWRQAVGLVPIDASLPADTAVARVVREWNDSLKRSTGAVLSPADTVRVASGADAACEKGAGYPMPQAAPVCVQQDSAPPAADLLMQYIADWLNGGIETPQVRASIRLETQIPAELFARRDG